jgi:predicted alpha/beta-fold hydrolase
MIDQSDFRPAPWLPGPHLQTLWPNVVRRRPRLKLRRERLELPDGDFLDLDWTHGARGPIVLVLHGLEGSSRSPYAAAMLSAAQHRGWRGVVLHARGCSGQPNRLARRYHAGETGDLEYVTRLLREREPTTPLAVVGYSLGGSVLLNWLAERESPPPLAAAVAVCVPFDLDATADRLNVGFSRLYQRVLLRSLYRAVRYKHRCMNHPLAHAVARMPANFREFDDVYTAPLHGFADAREYYRQASCKPKLQRIHTPVLILQAADDPFNRPASLPADHELSESVTLELSTGGGHVGFVEGPPWRPRYWLERRIPDYIDAQLRKLRPCEQS